jgi:hypothetical protein
MELKRVKTIDSYWKESITPVLGKLTPVISDFSQGKFSDLNHDIYVGLMEFDFSRDKSFEFDADKDETIYNFRYYSRHTTALDYYSSRTQLIIQNQTIDKETYRTSIIKGYGFHFSLRERVEYNDAYGNDYFSSSNEVRFNSEVLSGDMASHVRDYIESIFSLLIKVELGRVINKDNQLSHEKIITDFYNTIENRIEDAIREHDIQDQDHVYYRIPGLLTYAIDHFYRNRESYAIDYDPAEHAQTLSYQDVKIIIPSDKGYLGGEVHIGDDSIRLQVGGSDESIQRTGYFIKDEKQELDFISGKFIYYIFEPFVDVIQSIKTGHMRYKD